MACGSKRLFDACARAADSDELEAQTVAARGQSIITLKPTTSHTFSLTSKWSSLCHHVPVLSVFSLVSCNFTICSCPVGIVVSFSSGLPIRVLLSRHLRTFSQDDVLLSSVDAPTGVARILVGGTRHASVVHPCEAVTDSWGMGALRALQQLAESCPRAK